MARATGCARHLVLLFFLLQLFYRRDEAEAAAWNRLDHPLLGAIISHHLSSYVERIVQGFLIDHDIGPYRGMQLLTRYHTPAVAQQIEQHVEGLGLNVHQPPRPP